MQALGSNARTLIQKETTFKTTPASPAADLVYFISNSLRLTRNLITSTTIRGNRNPTKPVVGNKDVAGDIVVELQGYMGRLLEGAFGSVTSGDKELSYSSPTTAFTPGETITGGTSAETATVVWDDETNDVLYLANQSGAFVAETITGGTSGATATIAGDSSSATSPYVHLFQINKTAGATIPSYTIERGHIDINQYFLYNGCKVNSMSFSVVPEGFQEVTFSMIGAKETTNSSSYATSAQITDNGKSSFDGFTISTLEEGGSAIATVTTIDGLTLENNLDNTVFVIDPNNLGERAALSAGTTRVAGTLTALFEDLTLYNKAVNEPSPTETSLKIKYTLGTGDGSAGNEAIEFFIPELIFSPQAPIVESATGILVELPFEAYFDNTTNAETAMYAILWNTQASI